MSRSMWGSTRHGRGQTAAAALWRCILQGSRQWNHGPACTAPARWSVQMWRAASI